MTSTTIAARGRGPRSTSARPAPKERPPRRRRRWLWPLLAGVTIIGVVFVAVYPTRTWLAQRDALSKADRQLQVLKQQNDALTQQVAALDTDAEIERLAREKYNLVRPGEESYAINPAPAPPVVVAPVWPFTDLAAKLAATATP